MLFLVFFFNDTATTEIYTLSLHDALPILLAEVDDGVAVVGQDRVDQRLADVVHVAEHGRDDDGPLRVALDAVERSEEHTSELQSRQYLVCRLLLEKKTTDTTNVAHMTHDT